MEQIVGKVPIFIAVNKSDLPSEAQFTEPDVAQVAKAFECEYLMTSAKGGDNVEESFRRLGAVVAEFQLRKA